MVQISWGHRKEQSLNPNELYAGMSLGQWIEALDYRNEIDRRTLHPMAVASLKEALSKQLDKNREYAEELIETLDPLDLGVLHAHPSISILTVAFICTSETAGSDGVWALTQLLGDTRQLKMGSAVREWIRRTAACGLCHVGSAPALIALLDNAPYASGVCRTGLQLISEKQPMLELAPALSRFIRRQDVDFKHTLKATDVLASMGPGVLPQVHELLNSHWSEARHRGLEAVYTLGVAAAPLSEKIEEMLRHDDTDSIKKAILDCDLVQRLRAAR
jgi:hypothetical protein